MLGAMNAFVDELYLAGQCVPAGIYREIGTGREIRLEEEDILPGSLDGRIAAYVCIRYTWGQHLQRSAEQQSMEYGQPC
ncbi:MAG TPA: hypothetical protein VKU00_28190 [Chthonomonadaceae bacterium]|nr:hypothetical protein [Chthonomonadaceae bacterium]